MINNLSDSDIYSILMTSDFQDRWTSIELIEFLIKFRYYYRVSQARLEQKDKDFETIKKMFENDIALSEQNITSLKEEISLLKNTISILKNKKLSFKERIKGKIISENDTNVQS